jgi:hypothetical protein
MKTLDSEPVLTCSGDRLSVAVHNTGTCLSSLSRTEVVLELRPQAGKLEVFSSNGGASYSMTIKAATNGYLKPMKIPLNEMAAACAFMEEKQPVQISVGRKSGEILVQTEGCCFIFPSFNPGK